MSNTILKIFSLTLLLSTSVLSQEIDTLSFDKFSKEINVKDDTLYVINFWATWCRPCVKELPYFEEANKEFSNKPVKVILVNLDFNNKVSSVVIPFLKQRNIQSKVVHLTDTDSNYWINKVDDTWSGAIPATIFLKNGEKKYFRESEMNFEMIKTEINKAK